MRVNFDEPTHTYTDTVTSEEYVSVTTLVGKYEQPFDGEYWATYKALKDVLEPLNLWWKYKRRASGWDNVVSHYRSYGVNEYEPQVKERKKYYLDKWDKEKIDACDAGTRVHKIKEDELIDSGAYFNEFLNCDVQSLGNQDIDTFKGVENGVFAELLVYDSEYCIAGQLDKVLKKGKDIYIEDYKTSKVISNDSFRDAKMKFPLNELLDSNMNHYMLQLSLYGWIFERQGYIVRGLKLIHLTRDTGKHIADIELTYRPDLITEMVNHYKFNHVRV